MFNGSIHYLLQSMIGRFHLSRQVLITTESDLRGFFAYIHFPHIMKINKTDSVPQNEIVC